MGMRRIGSTQRKTQRAKTKARNHPRKVRERKTRDARMLTVLTAGGSLPYYPWVMSWLSAKLEKPSKKITPEDVSSVVSAHQAAASA